jgi:hypothetical protein
MRRLALIFMLCIALVRADYLGSWAIDDYLTIMATTHSPTTGAAAAASAITLRIYEDDTADEIVEAASMTAFDSITGLYKTKLQLTAAAGFEAGKCYTALIVATVSDVTAITTHLFQIQAKTTAVTVSDKTDYTLHSDYDAAKTAAQAGDEMDLVNAPNATAVAAIQSGLSTHSAADVKAAIEAGGSSIAQILADTGELQTNQGNWLTATGFSTHSAADVWAVATRQLTGTQTFNLTGNITGNLSGSVGSVTGAVGSVTGNVGGNVAGSVASVTGAVGSVTAGVTLANDAITAAKFDESTAFPLAAADTGATAIARTGADSDTLATLSDQIDGVSAGSGLDAAGVRAAIGLASANLDDQLTSIGASAGLIEYTYTLTTNGVTPIPNAIVEVYTDTERTGLVAKGTTNNFGVVTFYLDAGTYYFYRTKAGYTFVNPDVEVVAE